MYWNPYNNYCPCCGRPMQLGWPVVPLQPPQVYLNGSVNTQNNQVKK